MSRTIQDQVAALDWFAQRREFRKANLERVRRVEGLRPDKHTGDAKGMERMEAMRSWDQPMKFDIPDSSGLQKELLDMARDGELVDQSQRVKFEQEEDAISRSFTPRIEGEIESMTDDKLDEALQRHIESAL